MSTDIKKTQLLLAVLMNLLLINTTTHAQDAKNAEGCLKGDCIEGEGVFKYQDNTLYIGEFKEGKAEGYGICYYSDGKKYTGEWKNHEFEGIGTYDTGDGNIYSGKWKEGKLIEEITDLTSMETKEDVTPTVYAVVIGISTYQKQQSLRYTDDDAYRIYGFLKSPEGGAVADENIKILIDEEATHDKILRALNTTFTQATENDMVMVYYSGHGLKDAILPTDYTDDKNKIKYEEIYKIVDGSNAKHKLVIMDACHSGGMLSMKGDKAIPSTVAAYYDNLGTKEAGTAIITSSKREEMSIESEGLRQGIFSHFWIKALKGLADENNDNIITITEAFNYVNKNVVDYTGSYQTPQLDGDFDAQLPLAVIR